MNFYRSQGRDEFARGEYSKALDSFQKALAAVTSVTSLPSNDDNQGSNSKKDRQLLLSNIVACRLQLGGTIQVTEALNDAQACINCDPSWSKAHVRLASVYMALNALESAAEHMGNSRRHSNDVCMALQTALRCDPHNATARRMLVYEFSSREQRNQSSSGSSASASASSPPSAPPPITEDDLDEPTADSTRRDDRDDYLRDPPIAPSYIPPTTNTSSSAAAGSSSEQGTTSRATDRTRVFSSTSTPSSSTRTTSFTDQPSAPRRQPTSAAAVVSWNERLRNFWHRTLPETTERCVHAVVHSGMRAHAWYRSLSDDGRTGVNALLVLLLLYVAFGGRFGLASLFASRTRQEYHETRHLETYGRYDDPYQQRETESRQQPYDDSPKKEHTERETTASYPYQQQQGDDRLNKESYQQRASYQDSYQQHQPNQYHHQTDRYYRNSHHNHGGNSYHSYRDGGGGRYYGGGGGGGARFYVNSPFADSNGMVYVVLMLAAVAVAHRMGLSPWQIMLLLQMMNGRRHHGTYRHRRRYW